MSCDNLINQTWTVAGFEFECENEYGTECETECETECGTEYGALYLFESEIKSNQ